ncbi:UDP-glucose 4-epimerase GalE [Ramlibacter sp. H39-3-26]|uniref:UDP-glucose 4-epimerase GalE n=1 Tax=Curvibacter soli TaxID=3031331 RepID=UPI0023DBBE4D|nr:UDP-glucose 4-epimerase GalE [Ramlibacter sp. H39-3-26]MDF1486081.1 UDP-glucose 4-epimerase GalE [Ramlibacter sp. H39-3-26]
MQNILVVGGAGYIGSHMVWLLGQHGVQAVTLDNLVAGHRDAVLHGELRVGDVADRALLDQILDSQRFDAVMHFASFIQVGESVLDPAKYYRNNVATTLTLLDAMRDHGVRQFVFSSTAALFGEPAYTPIDEKHPLQPINPYGRSKWMVEQVLADYARAYGLQSVCLRYFNAAGAHPQGLLGERHEPETHLIPLVLQAATGRRSHVTVFGRDYDTPDGTCIRDYVHVMDLADAHWLALQYLARGGTAGAFNLGNGNGYSVQEVVDTARRVTGRDIAVREGPRRAGDPARLVADAALARQVLGWQPRHGSLEAIVRDAWQWECRAGGPAPRRPPEPA